MGRLRGSDATETAIGSRGDACQHDVHSRVVERAMERRHTPASGNRDLVPRVGGQFCRPDGLIGGVAPGAGEGVSGRPWGREWAATMHGVNGHHWLAVTFWNICRERV